MSAPSLTYSDVAHHYARDNFEMFVQLAFRVLEPGTKLSWAWYLDAMSAALMDVEKGDCRRLMITIPPRHMKSLIASVMFPAWVLGRDPSQKFICVSYNQDLSAGLSGKFRTLIRSGFYRGVFPTTATSFIKTSETDLRTRQGGYRFSTSLSGTVTGIGADYILIDDLLKGQEVRSSEARQRARDFYDNTLLSRLNNKATGRIVSIQQRLHADDLVAHLKEKGGFRELEFPATAVRDQTIALTHGGAHHRKIGDVLNPEREPQSILDEMRRDTGNRVYEAQYQQDPVAAGSQYIDWSRIGRYDTIPARKCLQCVIQSWDTAASAEPGACYSVCTTWGYDGEAWLLVDLTRVRLTYTDLLARARFLRDHWRADRILVEEATMGHGLLSDLRADCRFAASSKHPAPTCNAQRIQPRESKEERMMAQVEQLYNGFAKFPRQAPWLDDLHQEMRPFPEGRYDDQIDSISQFLYHASRVDPRSYDPDCRPPSIRRQGRPLRAR